LPGVRAPRRGCPAEWRLRPASMHAVDYVRNMLQAQAVDVQQADVTRCGGITSADRNPFRGASHRPFRALRARAAPAGTVEQRAAIFGPIAHWRTEPTAGRSDMKRRGSRSNASRSAALLGVCSGELRPSALLTDRPSRPQQSIPPLA
jgi:hypothetical protein